LVEISSLRIKGAGPGMLPDLDPRTSSTISQQLVTTFGVNISSLLRSSFMLHLPISSASICEALLVAAPFYGGNIALLVFLFFVCVCVCVCVCFCLAHSLAASTRRRISTCVRFRHDCWLDQIPPHHDSARTPAESGPGGVSALCHPEEATNDSSCRTVRATI